LPEAVVARAREVLEILEERAREGGAAARLGDDLPLFSAHVPAAPAPAQPSAIEARLRDIHPDELTPRAALEFIYQLRRELEADRT